MVTLSRVKRLLGMDPDAVEMDDLLKDVISLVTAQLSNRLGGVEEIPEGLDYIVMNVTAARYNQIGDEGKASMTVEGESASWLADLFAPFEEDIRGYLDRQGTAPRGSITFL